MLKTLLLISTLTLTRHLANAQGVAHDEHAAHTTTKVASELPWVQAEIRRIDPQARKITLRHGDIPNLDMPAMTMVFQVADAQWFSTFKVGERVRFSVAQVKGAYVVQRMERAE